MIREVEMTFENPFQKRIEYLVDDRVIGYLDYLLIYDRMEIEDFLILEDERGKGYGSLLMSYLVSIAIEKRVINITLEVRQSNIIAINLYKKYGFREVALRHNYYDGEDGILMEKQVM